MKTKIITIMIIGRVSVRNYQEDCGKDFLIMWSKNTCELTAHIKKTCDY